MIIIIIPILLLLTIDLYLILRPKSKLNLFPINYNIKSNNEFLEINCLFKILNQSKYKETMIPNLDIKLSVFNQDFNEDLKYKKKIILEQDSISKDITRYFPTTIIKTNSSIKIKSKIKFKSSDINKLNYLWFIIDWENYGHFGLINKQDCYLININKDLIKEKNIKTISINKEYEAIAIKTHLLGVFDDPIETITSYLKGIIQKNDVLVLGETPLAIMQGRYITPQNLQATLFSKILCYFFHPTSSLATAYGMQLLINKIGVTRITLSLLVGLIFKLIGIKGIFYRLTGPESSLIDDISGTTSPYDKTIVMGPKNSKNFCCELSKLLNIEVAVVDVNDLGGVKVLSSSNKLINNVLKRTLKENPAGNDDQKTPIVLIRKK